MANYYFDDTDSDQDPSNGANWWDMAGGSGGGGTCYNAVPGMYDDCFIDSGKTCSSSIFNWGTLTVSAGGILTVNDNTPAVLLNAGTIFTNSNTVTTNTGTIIINNGTIGDNQFVVVTNNNIITTRTANGSTTNEYQAADIPSGYTATILYAAIYNNYGQIGTLMGGYDVSTNYGGITTIASGGSVGYNVGTISNNYGTVSSNGGTITINQAIGYVTNNLFGALITSNLGTVRIGTITGGTGSIAANAATNLSSHTAGTNVTLPSGNTTWW